MDENKDGDETPYDPPLEKEMKAGTPKRHRKGLIIATTVVCVAIVAGIGFFIWHEQPSFCNAVCHEPMDSYVEGYYSGDTSLLVTAHMKAGGECLECHEAKFDEQIVEGTKWIAGDFETPLDDSGIGTREFCLSCHGDEWDDIVASTADWKGTVTVYNPTGTYNPHDNHRGDGNCSDCHRMHGTSTLYCVECHNMDVPEGWNGFE